MSWVKETWYYIKAQIRFGWVNVYTSTDGAVWTQITWASGTGQLDGQPADTALALPPLSGKFGLIGFGYSDEDTWPELPPFEPIEWPEPVIPPPIVVTTQLQKVFISTSVGMFITENFEGLSPAWYACNTDLTAGEKTSIRYIAFDRKHGSRAYMVNSSGVYVCSDIWSSAAWIQVMANAELEALIDAVAGPCLPCGATNLSFATIACDRNNIGQVVAMAGENRAVIGCGSPLRSFYSTDGLATAMAVSPDGHFANAAPTYTWPGVPGVANAFSRSTIFEDGYVTYSSINSAAANQGYFWSSADGGIDVDRHRGFGSFSNIQDNTTHDRAGLEIALHHYDIPGSVFRSSDGGVTWATKALGISLKKRGWNLAINRANSQNWMMIRTTSVAYKTTDNGASVGTLTDVPSTNPRTVTAVNVDTIGNDGERFIFGSSARSEIISYTANMGENTANKSGNLSTWYDTAADYVIQIIPFDSD
jgi:hypothetical protein